GEGGLAGFGTCEPPELDQRQAGAHGMRAGFAHRLGEVLAAHSLWPRADETQPAEVLEAESHSGEHGPDRGVERALRPGQSQSGLEVRRTFPSVWRTSGILARVVRAHRRTPGRTLISSTHTAETLMVRPSSPREARSAAESSSARMFAKVSASSRSASSPVMRNLC